MNESQLLEIIKQSLVDSTIGVRVIDHYLNTKSFTYEERVLVTKDNGEQFVIGVKKIK